jgi:hypothetical protein
MTSRQLVSALKKWHRENAGHISRLEMRKDIHGFDFSIFPKGKNKAAIWIGIGEKELDLNAGEGFVLELAQSEFDKVIEVCDAIKNGALSEVRYSLFGRTLGATSTLMLGTGDIRTSRWRFLLPVPFWGERRVYQSWE